jgi:hypothetical protein
VPHNLKALIHHIQTLISASACGKDTLKHLQDAGVGSRSRGGTTTTGSERRSSSRSNRRTNTRSPWILWHCRAKRVMMHILVKLLLHHRLNHELNVWSKATGSERVSGYVPYLTDPDLGSTSVDQNVYHSMIESLLYLCASVTDIMLSVCMCTRFQVTQRLSFKCGQENHEVSNSHT